MKITRKSPNDSHLSTEQTPLLPPDLLFQLAYGAVVGFLVFFLPLAVIDLLRLWPLVGLPTDTYYLQMCWNLIRLSFALIRGR
jgi:hypothetical protein